jgi:uracil-DNA glycosylase family 4
LTTREELLSLAKELRAHAEWQAETGATGVPRIAARASVGSPAPHVGAAARVAETRALAPVALSPAGLAPAGLAPAASAPELPQLTSPTHVPHPGDPRERLLALARDVSTCTKCVLHAKRTQTAFGRGNPAAELCFVGEGPGADEDEQGLPFVGKAGQLLDRMIAAMGFDRDDVYVCNIVKCRPPENRKPEPDEMAACTPYLRTQLELVAPKVIVALGATAVEGLVGANGGGITRLRGQWKLYRTIPVMPTFHPAYLLRNPLAKREVWADLQSVLKQLGRVLPSSRPG